MGLARKPVDVSVGLRLAAIRIARDVSAGQLASALGTTESRIRRYEAGSERVSSAHVIEICQFFQIKVTELFPASDPDQDQKLH